MSRHIKKRNLAVQRLHIAITHHYRGVKGEHEACEGSLQPVKAAGEAQMEMKGTSTRVISRVENRKHTHFHFFHFPDSVNGNENILI